MMRESGTLRSTSVKEEEAVAGDREEKAPTSSNVLLLGSAADVRPHSSKSVRMRESESGESGREGVRGGREGDGQRSSSAAIVSILSLYLLVCVVCVCVCVELL
jgi:hypothetical protein